MKVTILEDPWV